MTYLCVLHYARVKKVRFLRGHRHLELIIHTGKTGQSDTLVQNQNRTENMLRKKNPGQVANWLILDFLKLL